MIRSRTGHVVRSLAALAVAFVTLQASNCPGADKATGSDSSAAGTYTLTSIIQGDASCDPRVGDGCTIQNTGSTVVVVKSGTLTLSSDHSFGLNAAGTQNGNANDQLAVVAGTWTASGSSITFTTPASPVPVTASHSSQDNQIFFALPGQVFSSTQQAITVVFTKF